MSINPQRYRLPITLILLLSSLIIFCACSQSTPKPDDHKLSDKFYQNLLIAFNGRDYRLVRSGLDKINEAGIADKRTIYLGALLALIESQPDTAVARLQDALALDPEFGDAHNTLGTVYMRQKKYAEAKSEFLLACNSPTYQTPEKAYHNMGNLYVILGENRQAQSCYLKAIKINPGYFPSHYELSRLYLQMHQLDQAANESEKARQINPDHPGVWLQIGKIELAKGDHERANKAFAKVIKLQPGGDFANLANQEIKKFNNTN